MNNYHVAMGQVYFHQKYGKWIAEVYVQDSSRGIAPVKIKGDSKSEVTYKQRELYSYLMLNSKGINNVYEAIKRFSDFHHNRMI